MTAPIERFKDAYQNWRYNPFTDADMAVDKEEDDLIVPGGAPFVVQLIESPRKNTPTTVLVRAYDAAAVTTVDADSALGQKVLNVAATAGFASTDKIIINRGGPREEEGVVDTVQAGISLTLVDNLTYTHTGAQADAVEKYIEFTEVAGAPAQSQFRVDYPPFPANGEGKGTGLVEFNAGDASKVIRVNYKATGSPMISEFLDTKVSYPAGVPVDNQILGFVSGAPAWRYNPIRYFHEGPVIYHASGEDESCLLFRFKRGADEQKVFLELKGAKLHQGYYTELKEHLHAAGTLAGSQPTHQHGVGTLAAVAVGTHTHGVGTYSIPAASNHTHAVGTLVNGAVGNHDHDYGNLTGTQPNHTHGFTGSTASGGGNHSHVINSRSHDHGTTASDGGNRTGNANGCATPTGNTNPSHTHNVGTFAVGSDGNDGITVDGGHTGDNGAHNHTITGATATNGAHNHTISGASAAGGGHGHSMSGSVAAGGNDAVTIAGSTANAGGSPKTYPDQLKIYINSVDKTTEVLALTGLTQFGNGTAGHAFVTTGSGEMDISSLVAAAQIHELKITEPISAEGGRCCLHLELY